MEDELHVVAVLSPFCKHLQHNRVSSVIKENMGSNAIIVFCWCFDLLTLEGKEKYDWAIRCEWVMELIEPWLCHDLQQFVSGRLPGPSSQEAS